MLTKIKLFLFVILMILFSSNLSANYNNLAYDFNFKDLSEFIEVNQKNTCIMGESITLKAITNVYNIRIYLYMYMLVYI